MSDANRIDVDQHVVPPVRAGTLPTFPEIVRFGRFLLDSHRRELLADGLPVPIGGRAFDVLIVLIEARGGLVTKDHLLSRVWPSTIVEENTLQFQISALRKALGPDRDFIKTVSGHGYCFIAHISTQADPDAAWSAQRRDSPNSTDLQASPSDLIGREVELAEIVDLVTAHRLSTQFGDHGVDKTRVGTKPGLHLLSDFADRLRIAALGLLRVPETGLPTVATVFEVAEVGPAVPEGAVAALASNRKLLLVSIGIGIRL
jgi:DNA-binding winged helix-turn-helix (wHTH) protein